jgi:hypothetical protein
MDKKGKLILIIAGICILCVVGFKYKQFFADRDFLFLTGVNCDPTTESCFRAICDGPCDTSSSIMFTDGSPYKYVELPRYNAPQCLEEATCPNFECKESDKCSLVYCSDETLSDGEECVPSTATTTSSE